MSEVVTLPPSILLQKGSNFPSPAPGHSLLALRQAPLTPLTLTTTAGYHEHNRAVSLPGGVFQEVSGTLWRMSWVWICSWLLERDGALSPRVHVHGLGDFLSVSLN